MTDSFYKTQYKKLMDINMVQKTQNIRCVNVRNNKPKTVFKSFHLVIMYIYLSTSKHYFQTCK